MSVCLSCRQPSLRAAGIASIGEDVGDEGEALAGGLERQLAAVAILDVGAMDADSEEPTIGVGQDMTPFDFAQESLPARDLLARVIALVAPF